MSRKAKLPIILPKGVEAKLTGRTLLVKGPKGSLTRDLIPGIVLKIEEGSIAVSLDEAHKNATNFLGLSWSLIANMVIGVSEGFVKELEMIGVGFKAAVKGDLLDVAVGFSHPVLLKIPEGLQLKVEKNTKISVAGIDKQMVGQFAADIRAKRPPEPYKGKGIRYKDEYVRRKAGKAGKKA
ncbi:MAG: 50S ribosomal protein L6 [Chlamydiales bacterium]|nr:50S ribosomal protein L6 [Chlamydiales bacterium]MCH9619784.1 50S ribosomal protein L6 [Chlamydiales bacterium]MCH9623390.1 50S ribosomal protein L6 [Chlamydiales bacterium]